MDVEIEDNVWVAAGDGSIERTINFLGTGPVDVADENGYTPLMAACAYGHVELAKELLKRGANPNLKDQDGNTAVHHCDYPACLQALIDAGAKVQILNNDGESAHDMKQEELEDLEQNGYGGVEELETEDDVNKDEEETLQRLKALLSLLENAAAQEEARKKTRT